MMVMVLLLGLLCWPLGWVFQRSIEIRNQARCAANLTSLGVAMHQYHQKYGHLPPAFLLDANGRPAHSWRVILLEFLDPTLFADYDFNEQWDGPHNSKLATRIPAVYACPNRYRSENSVTTSYVVIVGPESAFPGEATLKFSEMRDATSGVPVILVGEAERMGILWSEPRDLRVDQMSFSKNDPSRPSISSDDPGGAGLLFAEGNVRRVKPTIHEGTLKGMLSISKNIWMYTETY
jgi:hypothetical protein